MRYTEHSLDIKRAQNVSKPAAVIVVRMAQDEQIQAEYAFPAQIGIEYSLTVIETTPICTAINYHVFSIGKLYKCRVALTNIKKRNLEQVSLLSQRSIPNP